MWRTLRPSLAEYIEEALVITGAESEMNDEGVRMVLLPEAPDLCHVTFEPEVARETSGVELITFGSRFLETLIHLGMKRGRLSRIFAITPGIPPPPISSVYRFKVKQVTQTEWAPRFWTTWVFAFEVRLRGEFRREQLELCAVDAATLRLVRRFTTALERLVPGGCEQNPIGDHPFEACYQAARAEVMERAETAFRRVQRESEEELAKELSRVERYYKTLVEEMREDLLKVDESDPRRSGILSRIAATQIEREKIAAQTRARYHLNLEIEVLGAFGAVYPRSMAHVTLIGEKEKTATLEVAWDPILGEFMPLPCPACGRPTYTLEWTQQGLACGCQGAL